MKKKKWIKIGSITFVLIMAINIVASFYFYDLAIKREKKDFLVGNDDLTVSSEAMDVFIEGSWRDWESKQRFAEWSIHSFDGLKLFGNYLEAEESTNKTVIFAHGYLGKSRDMALYGQHYYEDLGYNIFSPDLRGHGKSEGDYIGFGWHDRLDYVKWIDRVIEEQGPDTEIILHGLSMGAATVLMTSGEDLPDNVKAVVADSPYTSSYDLFDYQMERMYNLPSFPVLPTTSLVTNMQAGYSLTEASALEQVKKAEVPILYLHGDNDSFVPTDMTNQLYSNTKSEAEMTIFENAGHGEAFAIYPDKYESVLNEFLTKYMD